MRIQTGTPEDHLDDDGNAVLHTTAAPRAVCAPGRISGGFGADLFDDDGAALDGGEAASWQEAMPLGWPVSPLALLTEEGLFLNGVDPNEQRALRAHLQLPVATLALGDAEFARTWAVAILANTLWVSTPGYLTAIDFGEDQVWQWLAHGDDTPPPPPGPVSPIDAEDRNLPEGRDVAAYLADPVPVDPDFLMPFVGDPDVSLSGLVAWTGGAGQVVWAWRPEVAWPFTKLRSEGVWRRPWPSGFAPSDLPDAPGGVWLDMALRSDGLMAVLSRNGSALHVTLTQGPVRLGELGASSVDSAFQAQWREDSLELPPGLAETLDAAEYDGAATRLHPRLRFAPDGHLFVATPAGVVRIASPDDAQPSVEFWLGRQATDAGFQILWRALGPDGYIDDFVFDGPVPVLTQRLTPAEGEVAEAACRILALDTSLRWVARTATVWGVERLQLAACPDGRLLGEVVYIGRSPGVER